MCTAAAQRATHASTARTALRRMAILLPQMMMEAELTEELKNTDSFQWVGTMNAITAQIEEILLSELVYS